MSTTYTVLTDMAVSAVLLLCDRARPSPPLNVRHLALFSAYLTVLIVDFSASCTSSSLLPLRGGLPVIRRYPGRFAAAPWNCDCLRLPSNGCCASCVKEGIHSHLRRPFENICKNTFKNTEYSSYVGLTRYRSGCTDIVHVMCRGPPASFIL